MTALKHYIVSAILAIVMMQVATIWATPNHPFWTGAQYTIADSLHVGDRLYGADGGNIFIEEIIRKDTSAEVYNFAVEDNENYFDGRSSVLVHNSNCFLKNIENLDILSANLNNLSPLLKRQFLQDFEKASSELLEVLNKPNGVKAWESVSHLKESVRLNTTILGKIDNLRSAEKIPEDKLDLVLKNQLGEILDAADGAAVNKILDRLNMSHVNEAHFDKITQRLTNPEYKQTLLKDLKDNPQWFETFDDILKEPGKYWDILNEGNLPSGSALAQWGQGFWWKNLRELADQFEKFEAIDNFRSLYTTSELTK